MSFFSPAPLPKSKLGFYRKLSTAAGVHVSPIALGGGNIGNKWLDAGITGTNKDEAFKLLDAYHDLGGNFIDTANAYQDGESEIFIGEWMKSRGIRDQIFVATKYTNSPEIRDPNVAQKIQFSGNSLKSMHVGIEGSLKRLNTSYIDLFYVHWWDFTTSIPELMQALHGLVLARKVLYLGISDAPAWVVTKANQYARDHALTQFSVYQGMWSILERSFERDIIPMARDEGIALAPWAVLAGGKIRSDAEEERRRQSGEKGRAHYGGAQWERTEDQIKVCRALEKVAAEVGAKSIGAVAIAYVLHKTTFVFPIIGGRKVENLLENIEALDIALTDEHLKFLDSIAPLDLGFPHNLIGNGFSTAIFNNANGYPTYWPAAKPISPAQ
ncbi:Aldo/keto reductase [Coprinellus micaceus]|uniref:Aldo/keto reductase n=1 Tax=Coprinellus micaceus TaxID=71717 RepID=A0A4Y7TCY1_COPMI|nr:Aldo/keto reductase [Coprinellus micaceus]